MTTATSAPAAPDPDQHPDQHPGRRAFSYEALPMRVVFGAGRVAQLADELDHLGLQRVLVLCTPGQEDAVREVTRGLGTRIAGTFAGARQHVPAAVAAQAVQVAHEVSADACLAVGGGSTTGLGKAVVLRSGLPVVAVPTTYAGSEMTPVWGVTEGGVKRTGRDPRVLPRSVVYDPDLTLALPVGLSVSSGLNAVAHAVEALYAPDASPVVSLMAEEGVRALFAALPGIVEEPRGATARSTALYGAWLCGAVLGATTMSLHHKLCHVLGGAFDLPHADTHAVLLPHVLAFNAPAAPAAVRALARALALDPGQDPARALWDLGAALGAPTSLGAIGLPAGAVESVVDRVVRAPYANPRPVGRRDLAALLTRALHGEAPPASTPPLPG